MKKIILISFLLCVALLDSGAFAQNTPTPLSPAGAGTPAGAGDKNLSEELRKLRSIELERIKREAERTAAFPDAPKLNSKVETKFPEIKEDFEGLQISQAAIIKTYTTDKTIDYVLMDTSAQNIKKHAKRLDSNVFEEITENKKPDAKQAEAQSPEKQKSLRDLIIELDNAIGDFVTSKLFANLRVVDPEIAIKTRADLLRIMELSDRISAETKKTK